MERKKCTRKMTVITRMELIMEAKKGKRRDNSERDRKRKMDKAERKEDKTGRKSGKTRKEKLLGWK